MNNGFTGWPAFTLLHTMIGVTVVFLVLFVLWPSEVMECKKVYPPPAHPIPVVPPPGPPIPVEPPKPPAPPIPVEATLPGPPEDITWEWRSGE
jgi:hypothetical protein